MTNEEMSEVCAVWREEAVRSRMRCRMLEAEHSKVLSRYASMKERIELLESQLAEAKRVA